MAGTKICLCNPTPSFCEQVNMNEFDVIAAANLYSNDSYSFLKSIMLYFNLCYLDIFV